MIPASYSIMHVCCYFRLSALSLLAFSHHIFLNILSGFSEKNEKYAWPKLLSNYSRSIVLLLLVISVIPPVVFLYYAYNEEKMESVKIRQLQLARDIQTRSKQIQARHNKNKKYKDTIYNTFYNTNYINNLIIDTNVFTGDQITSLASLHRSRPPTSKTE